MKEIKKMLPYLAVILLDFYLLPFMIKDTGTAMLMLLVVVPLVCFVCSVAYGVRNSLNLFYSLTAAILFVPSIYIFYNASAWVYVPGYGAAALAGNAVGTICFKRKN